MKRALPLAVVVLATAGCGNPSGGDPGNKRFDELRADGVFARAPAGATDVHVVAQKATVATTGLARKNWEAPTVSVSFRTAAPPASVFRFYAGRAAASGWNATRSGVWSKTYADGAAATLLLVDLRRGRWVLNGGVSIPGS